MDEQALRRAISEELRMARERGDIRMTTASYLEAEILGHLNAFFARNMIPAKAVGAFAKGSEGGQDDVTSGIIWEDGWSNR